MATYNRVSTVRSFGKKALQADVNKKKKEMEEDSTRKWVQYIATLPAQQQEAIRQQRAQRMANPGNLRPATPSLRDMRYDVARAQLITNREQESRNRTLGLYDTEAVAYNPDTAHLPSDSYMKKLQESLSMQLASSRVQDDFHRAQEERLSPWEDWYYNMEGEPDDYDLKAMDTLLTGKEYPSWYELTADERAKLMGDYTRMKAQVEGDMAQATPYQSQTPMLQARYDLLAQEQERRSKGAAYQEMATNLRSSPAFEQDSRFTVDHEFGSSEYEGYMGAMRAWGWSAQNLGKAFSALNKPLGAENAAEVMEEAFTFTATPQELFDFVISPDNYTGNEWLRNRGLHTLTDSEKAEAAAAMAQGEETFTKWLAALEQTGELTRRNAELDRAVQENLAENPVTAVPMWVGARLANMASTMNAPWQAISALSGNTDPNSPLFASNNFSRNVSSVQAQAAGELLPWQVPFTDQKLGEFLYNGVTALTDTGLATGIGAMTKAPAVVTQLVMSSQAASNTVQNALTEGMDPTEAVARGAMAAIIEAFTEKYSIEALLRNPSSIASFIGKNFLTEATEEGASTILNTVADGFISSLTGRESELEAEYNSLLAQGANEKEASQQVLEGWLRGLSGDVLLGGLTGGAIGTAVGAQTSARRSAVGKEVSNLGNVSKLVDIGLTMDVNGESNPLARTIKQAEASGKKVSKRQVGRLYETMYRELDEQSRAVVTDTMRDAVAERMVELGDSPEVAQEAADAVLAVVRNEKPSLGQRQSMARAQSSTQVIKEIMFADDFTSEGRLRHSEWVRTADEKANAAGAASLRKMGELRQTRVGKEATDQAIQRATVNAQQMVAKKATDKKSMDVELEDGQSAEILQVSNAEGEAKVTIKGADGKKQTVSASDLRIKSRPVAAIVSYLDTTSERMSDEQANLLLHSYTGGDAAEHIADFNDAYAAGFMARELPPSKRMDRRMAQQIAEQGRKDAEAAEQKRQATIGAIATGRRGAVTFTENMADAGSEKALKAVSGRLSDTQKKSVAAIKQLARATGVNFVFFESQADDAGRYTAENGHYDVKTGTIYLDLNSGKNSTTDLAEYAILRTAGHELTHFMEHSSKEGYAALRDFVTTELTRRGEDFDALVVKKMDNAARSGAPLTRAGAISEVVADASELMLRDTKAIERLAQKDQGLMAKIKGFIQSFVQKVRDAFSGVDAVHEEARVMMQELAEEFQQKWDFALEEAVEQAREGAVEAEPVVQYSPRDFGLSAISEEDLSNIHSRGNVVVQTRDQLLGHVQKALDGNDQLTVFIGSIGETLKNRLESETQVPLFRRGLDYAYGVSYDCIRHIKKHFSTAEEIADAIQYIFSMLEDHDSIEPVQRRDGGYNLRIRKNLSVIELEAIAETSKRTRSLTVKTAYIAKVHEKRATIRQADTSNDPGAPRLDRVSDTSIPENSAVDNREFAETQNSLRDMPAISTREYIASMQPVDSMTDSEKWLLGKYQQTAEELREKEASLAEQIRLSTDADTPEEQQKAKNRAAILRTQANRLRNTLSQAERAEGFATIMRTSRDVVQNYLAGRNANQVADAVDTLEAELQGIQKQLLNVGESIRNAEAGQRAAYARGLFNAQALNQAAGAVKKAYNLRMSTKTLADRLALAYAEMYANDAQQGAARFYAALESLAQDILANSRNRYASPILDALKERVGSISISDAQEQELRNAGISMSEFRRVVNPVVNVTRGTGSDLNAIVSSAEYYGTGLVSIFSAEDSEGDMILKLYNVIKEERAKERSGTFEGMSEAESLRMVAVDVMGMVNLPLASADGNTTALRAELLNGVERNAAIAKKVDNVIEAAKKAARTSGAVWRKAADVQVAGMQAVAYYRAIDEQRRLMELQEQKKNITNQLRSEAAQKLLNEQTRYRQMIATDREVRKLTQQARQMQEKIATRVRKLDKLRRQETDYKNIPEAFKPAVDTLVSMFTDNFGTMVFDKQRADRLSAIYHKLLTVDGNDPMAALKPFYDPNMEEYLDALTEWAEKDAQLRTTSGTRMEKAQLRLAINKGVLDAVDHITTIVTNAQDLFYAGKKAKFDAIGTQMGDALKARQDKKTLRGAAGQALTVMDNLLRTGNMTPVYFFEQLGNEVLSTLWDDIRQGQNAYAFAMRDGRETIQGLQQLYHYWDWVDSKRKDNVLEITTEKGRKLTFTREQALWVYATWKREQSNEIAATKHLTEGCIVYEGKKQEGGKVVTTVQSTPAVLSEGDIGRITGWLTDEQKAYADGMVKYLSEDMADLGNRASMEMFGIRKYTESYYFPYRTDGDQLYKSSTSGRLDTTSDSRLKHASFTHALTQGASAALVMGDFSAVVEDHIAHMATYASFVLPIESMNRVLNYKVTLEDDSRATVRSLIEQKYGKSAKEYIATLLTDLNGGVRNDNRASGTDYLVRMYKKGAVAASLSTALQQPTSLFRAMAMISPKYIAASTFSKRDWEELTRYSGVAVIKDMGRFDTDVGRSNIDWLHKKHPRGFMERLDAASGFLPEQLDRLTWAHLWSAVKKEQADLHPEMDKQGEAFLTLCGERFNDIVDHTQVYDSILSRSQLMRGKDAMSKMTTSFMAEPTLTLNMLYNAVAGITKPGGKAKAAKVMAAVLTSNIAAAAMAALIQAWNDDDDKRSAQTKYLDKFLENALDNSNPLSMLPVVSDVWSMFQGYDVQRADMSLISEMYKAIQRFQSDSYSPYRKMEELVGTTAKFFGLPVKNLMRDGRRAYNLFTSSFESPSSYELSTALPWADDKATAHYEELFLAMHNGDTKREEEIRGYLADVKGKQTDAQNEGVRDRLKERFLGGSMDEATAKAWLKTHMGYDNRKAFETVDRWRETQENKGNEEWSYSIYNDFYNAVESGKNLDKEIKQLLDLGIEAKTLASNITTEFKPLLLELLSTGKMTQAAALQAKILDAYVALGYDREKKLKDVKKWYSK